MHKTDKRADTRTKASRDIIAIGIAVAAIVMFVGTGGTVLPQILRSWSTGSAGPDAVLVNALLLNIALIIFGLRRYRELIAEIEERCKAESRAQMLAETDPLTGCLNRRSVTPETDTLIKTAAKSDRAVAFLMIDLDNFKQVNDLNGHKVGDRLLKETADTLRKTMPADGKIARLGGDEFACIMTFAKNAPDTIDQIASALITAVGKPMTIDGYPVEITISVGIATNMHQPSEDAVLLDGEAMMHRADIAMYHAKKQGKDRYFWFDPSMEKELRFRNELESGIKRGILEGEYEPYYEQQIDLATNEIVGFEMLARWNSPELGLVNPAVFIPVAEELGVIAALSEQLIEQSLKDAKDWHPSLTLSVNISPIQLRDPWFSQKLLKLLVKHNFPPQRLEIEITESCLHENIGVVKSMITSLKTQGIKISLDDFGTGYSSLSQLRSLPFDRLKIDRSFVGELKEEDASEKIVNAIISLGDGLDMPVTAEGIEDQRVVDVLKDKGAIKGQGYLYGRPETAAKVRERLAAQGLLANAPARATPAGASNGTAGRTHQLGLRKRA
ncbi:putative bifunctional diguanylate cyclase/phosphodiesterase [Pontixanthobacter sp.]|uniref:putative bifunctional diguanylate cyclase/phosphodiesterase n=1 Tax=Pontixanthobacter sp. TaxID=2792078 RepID=UPI003C7A5619